MSPRIFGCLLSGMSELPMVFLGVIFVWCVSGVMSVVVHLGIERWRFCFVRYDCREGRYLLVLISAFCMLWSWAQIVMSSAYCVMKVLWVCGVGMSAM